MKISVSYLSSKYGFVDTIKKINKSSALYIHMDIMDGKYVFNKNIDKLKLKYLGYNKTKKIDVHLMTMKPSKYIKYLKSESFEIVYFHPETEKDPFKLINKLKKMQKLVGIVINPDQNINDFENLYKYVDYVLLMSVTPGSGGQKFKKETIKKIDELVKILKNKENNFKISIDGGINDEVIKLISKKKIEYAVSGSYICKVSNFDTQIKKLTEEKK